ncbi:hypothetical protein [Leucobacter chromiireducens]|uniref:hypothetical protein n=1 Tax=Leucobacter chromiireducens TaxID=283877 RepID=UPI000F6396F3|nr:hypothetical protein [Leucobacter chromiireducens]
MRSTEHVAASARVLTVESSDGLSTRGRIIAGFLTVILLFGLGIGLAFADALPTLGGRADTGATPTHSDPQRAGVPRADASTTAGTEVLPASVVTAQWDGPAVHLDWTGAEYARAETTFIGDRTASPGDRVERTLNVVNAGPGAGVASVTLDLAEVIPPGAANPRLAEDVTLFWNIGGVTGSDTFAALHSADRVSVAELAVPAGETVPVTVGFAMDAAVEGSRADGADSTILSFDVGVNLTGETTPPEPPKLAITGAAGLFALISIAAALILLGVLLVVLRRRRRDRDEDAAISETLPG